MATNTLVTAQLMQALARGDKAAAVGLLRDAGMPALRQALGELQAQAAGRPKAWPPVPGQTPDTGAQHGIEGHAQAARQALRAHGRTPTVEMGDAPGSLRWLLVVLLFLGLLGWVLLVET